MREGQNRYLSDKIMFFCPHNKIANQGFSIPQVKLQYIKTIFKKKTQALILFYSNINQIRLINNNNNM